MLTADAPLVLVLEDLQWSDRSTVDLLASLAQRREPAQLLVLGTYRPVDLVLHAHPLHGLVQELGGRGLVRELPLELLPAEDVAAYLAGRLGGPVAPPLAAFVHARTDGHPLFLVNLVEHLVQQRLLARGAGQWTLRAGGEARVAQLPEEVRQLLTRRLDALPAAARQVLEVASVVGQAFAAAAVAAGTQGPVEAVDAVCDGLVAHAALSRGHRGDRLARWDARGRVPLSPCPLPAGAVRGAGDDAAGPAAPPGGGPPGGRVWRPGGGHRGPAGPPLRARGRGRSGPCTISSRRRTMPPGAMPIMKRSPPSPKGWRCWRPSPRAPRAPGTNSRSCCAWGRA